MGASMTVLSDAVYYTKLFYVPVNGGNTIVAYHPFSGGHVGITDLSTLTEGTDYKLTVRPVAWFQ